MICGIFRGMYSNLNIFLGMWVGVYCFVSIMGLCLIIYVWDLRLMMSILKMMIVILVFFCWFVDIKFEVRNVILINRSMYKVFLFILCKCNIFLGKVGYMFCWKVKVEIFWINMLV